jgi:Ubiquitin-2 like Rad60 SUMO-like
MPFAGSHTMDSLLKLLSHLSPFAADMPYDNGENLRLICMGKGYLSPDSRTLADCQVPVFKTHPTPVNVSVKPNEKLKASDGRGENAKKKVLGGGAGNSGSASPHLSASNAHTGGGVSRVGQGATAGAMETGQGCGCRIQ